MRIEATEEIPALREVAGLFAQVWGTTAEGVPLGSEMMRSLVHAGGLVSVARSDSGELVGAAVLGRSRPGECYSYLAAVRPGTPDRGIGFALKQHQRSWALDQGLPVMRWTFDPLVARNARFNLTKLGALATAYERGFYGAMQDEVNRRDDSDRLVPTWRLDGPRAATAAAGTPPEPVGPSPADLATALAGPDGRAARVVTHDRRWIRVPDDVVTLRRARPDVVAGWRASTRAWFEQDLAEGLGATGLTRDGWYVLEADQDGSAS